MSNAQDTPEELAFRLAPEVVHADDYVLKHQEMRANIHHREPGGDRSPLIEIAAQLRVSPDQLPADLLDRGVASSR